MRCPDLPVGGEGSGRDRTWHGQERVCLSGRMRALVLAGIVGLLMVGCVSTPDYRAREAAMADSMRRGAHYEAADVHNQAYRFYNQALRNTAYTVNIFYPLGQTCQRLGKTELARYYLIYSLKYYPEDHRAYLLLGQLWASGRPGYARRLAQAGLAHVPPHEREQAALQAADVRSPSRSLFETDDLETGAREILQAVKEGRIQTVLRQSRSIDRSTRCAMLIRAAVLLEEHNRIQESILLREHVHGLNRDPDLLLAIGNLHFRGLEFTRASTRYLEYTRVRPEDGKGYFNLGIVYLGHGLEERAEIMFAKAGPVYAGKAAAAKTDHVAEKSLTPLD
ncbi:tetratricopeptide repeat protein [Planctomycetota bacterium]